jgi:hypothetical protein
VIPGDGLRAAYASIRKTSEEQYMTTVAEQFPGACAHAP